MLSSLRLRDVGVAAVCGRRVGGGVSKLGAAWLVPFGTAALFWMWQGASWKRAALLGWLAGMIFFALDYAWVGHSIWTVHRRVCSGRPDRSGALRSAVLRARRRARRACVSLPARRPRTAGCGGGVRRLRMAAFDRRRWARRSISSDTRKPIGRCGRSRRMPARTALRSRSAYSGAYLADAIRRRTWRPLATRDGCHASPRLRWRGQRGRRAGSRRRRFPSRRFKATSRSRSSGITSRSRSRAIRR